MQIWQLLWDSFRDYARYFFGELANWHVHNYLYWLIGLSLLVYGLELLRPWRKEQRRIRHDFWLDAFYMLFNFFLFPLLGFFAISQVCVFFLTQFFGLFGLENTSFVEIAALPIWAQWVNHSFFRSHSRLDC